MLNRRRGVTIGAALTLILAVEATSVAAPTAPGLKHPGPASLITDTGRTSWTYKKLTSPARVQVLDGGSTPLATFTLGARTVTVRGPQRVFAEPATTTAQVTSTTWVRLSPRPFAGTVDTAWLRQALDDGSPDVLATAAQYTTGAPVLYGVDGARIAGDADYGPLQSDGTRTEGADFNDYLGVDRTYGSVTDRPEPDQVRALDCSGFVRMVFGYRSRLPMTLAPDGVGLPRRAADMLGSAPGVVTVPDRGVRPGSTAALSPGDLLFFDGSRDDGSVVDHVGIYLGLDETGAPRFLSSRKTVNGPTLGDVGGKSVISGTGHYALAWRAVRRL